MRILAIAVETGSLTSAAATIHVTQPAASQAIAKLNSLYNCQLLERSGNRILPTAAGGIVNNRGKRALALLHEAGRKLGERMRGNGSRRAGELERQATISQLRAISMFARTSSFALAAQALDQAETSVRRAVKEFEQIAGVSLIGGDQGIQRLTGIGVMLAERASLMLRELDTIFDELRENEGLVDGRVAVGTLPLARTRIVPEAIVAVAGRHPQARIELVDGAYETLLHQLNIGEIDMIVGALRTGPLPGSLRQDALFRDDLSVVARSGHPLATLSSPTVAQLAQYPWIVARKDTPNRQIFERLLGRSKTGYVETASLATIRGILLISDFLTLISRRQVEYELRTGMFAEIRFRLDHGDREIGLTYRKEWLPTRLQREFLRSLKQSSIELDSSHAA